MTTLAGSAPRLCTRADTNPDTHAPEVNAAGVHVRQSPHTPPPRRSEEPADAAPTASILHGGLAPHRPAPRSSAHAHETSPPRRLRALATRVVSLCGKCSAARLGSPAPARCLTSPCCAGPLPVSYSPSPLRQPIAPTLRNWRDDAGSSPIGGINPSPNSHPGHVLPLVHNSHPLRALSAASHPPLTPRSPCLPCCSR